MRNFLFLLLLGIIPAAGAESVRCQELFIAKSTSVIEDAITTTFADVFRSKTVYRCLECHLNVKRFFQRLRANYPTYDFSEMKVLYITHQNMPYDSSPDVGFRVKSARGSTLDDDISELIFWNFHVVIEFRGKIYDFDYTESPAPIPVRDYVREFFFSREEIDLFEQENNVKLEGPADELIVFALPGNLYFPYKNQEINTWDFHLSLFANHESIPLLRYINPN